MNYIRNKKEEYIFTGNFSMGGINRYSINIKGISGIGWDLEQQVINKSIESIDCVGTRIRR